MGAFLVGLTIVVIAIVFCLTYTSVREECISIIERPQAGTNVIREMRTDEFRPLLQTYARISLRDSQEKTIER
jgi:hypothetical protein